MIDVDDLIALVRNYNPRTSTDLIRGAYDYGRRMHDGQKRHSGEDYFTHPVAVAAILTEQRLDDATIVTALLHDTIEDTKSTFAEVARLFGEEVAELVDGVTKLTNLQLSSSETKQSENFRKLFMAMSKDLRVILVKLADRLHNMRTMEAMTPAKRVRIAYNNEDLATWASFVSPLHQLAWCYRTENWNPDADRADGADILMTVTSGRSGKGLYIGRQLVLFDARYRERMEGKLGPRAEGLLVDSGYDYPWVYAAAEFPARQVEEAGFVPVARRPGAATCPAFFDPKRRNLVCADVTESSATALACSFGQYLAGQRELAAVDATWPDVLELSDGAIHRSVRDGLLTVATTDTCTLAGELPRGQRLKAGALELVSTSPIGTIVATSLDGQPLDKAQKLAVKMVTVARNRGQQLDAVTTGEGAGRYVLNSQGSAPVQTAGVPSALPTTVWIGGEKLVDAYLANGTWEVVVDRARRTAEVFCDTPNVRFALNPHLFGATAGSTRITKYFTEYPPTDAGQRGPDFIYPGFAKYVRLSGRSPQSEAASR